MDHDPATRQQQLAARRPNEGQDCRVVHGGTDTGEIGPAIVVGHVDWRGDIGTTSSYMRRRLGETKLPCWPRIRKRPDYDVVVKVRLTSPGAIGALGVCINKKVVLGLVIVAGAIWWLGPSLLASVLPLLAVAVCPLSMLLTMKAMSTSQQQPETTSAQQTETTPPQQPVLMDEA